MQPDGAIDQDSAYKMLINEHEFNKQAGGGLPRPHRATRTRDLLSGGYGKPQPLLHQQQQPLPFLPRPAPPVTVGPPPQPPGAPFLEPRRLGGLPLTGLGGLGGLGGDPASPIDLRRFGHRQDHHRRHRSRSRSRSRRSWSSTSSRGYYSRSITSGASSGSGYDSSSSSSSSRSALRLKQRVLKTIREYCPDNFQGVVYEDVVAQMKQLDQKGYKLPPGYDHSKHDISENEIKLYEQQLHRDRDRDQKKMANIINFAAFGLSWFCRFVSVDFVKTGHLQEVVSEALKDGDFDDCFEGIGGYMRGTVIDNPIFSMVLKFAEKVGEAHHLECEEEQEKLEEREEKRGERHRSNLKKLNQFRNVKEDGLSTSQTATPPPRAAPPPAFNVPPPPPKKTT